MEVRGVGAEAARTGHRLVEGGPDAVSGSHLGQKSLTVGRAELLDLPVGQEVPNHRVVVTKPLQGRRVGGISGLGLLSRGQTQILKQDLSELLGGVHVELLTRRFVDQAPKTVAVGSKVTAQPGQLGHVNPDAYFLHSGQDSHQRNLQGGVELPQPLGVKRRDERVVEGLSGRRSCSCLSGWVGSLPGEVQLAVRRAGGRKHLARVALQQRAQVVRRVGRVEEVCG